MKCSNPKCPNSTSQFQLVSTQRMLKNAAELMDVANRRADSLSKKVLVLYTVSTILFLCCIALLSKVTQ